MCACKSIIYISTFYLSLRLDKMRTLKKRDFFFFLSLSLNLSQDSDCLSACVCSSEEKKEEELVRRFSLCVCSSDLSARACVCVARVCFYGENLIKKNLFFGPERKTAAGFNKKNNNNNKHHIQRKERAGRGGDESETR